MWWMLETESRIANTIHSVCVCVKGHRGIWSTIAAVVCL